MNSLGTGAFLLVRNVPVPKRSAIPKTRISKSGAYALMSQPVFPTLQIGERKLVTKTDLIE